jgi:8-oxo-dGTP pyrophosphatase MutT (NUDIX family)
MITPLNAFVQAACTFDPSDRLLPLNVDGVLAGWMKKTFAERLEAWPELFVLRPRGVGMIGEFANAELRSAALAQVVESLATQDVIRGWRDEMVDVGETFHSPPLFYIERAASHYFGLKMYASHLNGLTTRNGQPYMWLATRSARKYEDPGKLDNIAAGRIARGYTPMSALIKESFEEAGIPNDLATQAHAAGAVRCKHKVEEGLHNEIMFVHDLVLPESFVPTPQDGEVESFECVPIADLLKRLKTPQHFTIDSALVIIDCLLRRGYITAEREDYLDLIHAMRP